MDSSGKSGGKSLRLLAALLACLSLPAADTPEDAARWIVEQGGTVETGGGSRITGVRLGLAWLMDADLDKLSSLRGLRKLDLSLSLITDLGMQRIEPLDTVTDLNLTAVEHITDAGISYIRGWKGLERLSLRGTDITDTTLQEYIPALTNLRSLDISYTQITNAGLESLAALENLEELALGANKINGAGLHVLKLLPRLKRLSLHGRQARNTEVWSVVLTDLDLKLIGSLTQLEALNLGDVRMTDFGANALSSLTELRSLDLSQTQITSKALEVVAKLPKLERLTLWRVTKIDDTGAAQVAAMRNLTVLDVAETPVSDVFLGQLPSKQLRKLYLRGSKVTAAGVDAFRQNNPDCEVSWD